MLKDARNYPDFLQKPQGGLWFPNEITSMARPTKGDVLAELERVGSFEYVLVVFSGHGVLRADGATELELRVGQTLGLDQLYLATPGQTLIIDCCRMPEPTVRAVRAAEELLKGLPSLRPEACRKSYEERIALAGRGRTIMYACSRNQWSYDNSETGGVYSHSLLSAGNDWVGAQSSPLWGAQSVLSVVQAHDAASPQVQRHTQGKQIPQIEKPRSGPYFPFCVVA